jgi:Tfp pilus assembly protein PilF
MSRAVLLYGNQALLDEYNEHVAEKLNTNSSVKEDKSTETVGLTRGIQMMMRDVEIYQPCNSYFGEHAVIGGLFDAKKQFYRLISLLLSDLGVIFNIRSPSPWEVISELQTQGIIDESDSVNIRVCLSIANEIRLKTYFGNNGQKELFSPVENANNMEQSSDAPIFCDFDKDVLGRLLSISNDICSCCREVCSKYIEQDKIDVSLFQTPSLPTSRKAWLLGYCHIRLQNFHRAFECMKSVSKDSPEYATAIYGQGLIYFELEEYDKSGKYFEEALQLCYQNEEMPNKSKHVIRCISGLGATLYYTGKCEVAITKIQEAIGKHNEIYGEGSQSLDLIALLLNLGFLYNAAGDFHKAVKTSKDVLEMEKGLTNVPKHKMISLNLNMATSLCKLDQHEQALEYLQEALRLSNMVFGEHAHSMSLPYVYLTAAEVYNHCNRDNDAESFFKKSLKLFGNKTCRGKIIT